MGTNKASNCAVDDDFFGNQTDTAVSRKDEGEREWNALRRVHVKAGYREGSEAGHDAKLQDGFDSGFLAGAKATADAGYWLGVSAVIEAVHGRNKAKKNTTGTTAVSESELEDVREARRRLEKAANGINDDTDGGTALDTSAIRVACTKIVGNISNSADV